MRRIVLLLASIALAVIFVSGVALADSPTSEEDCKNGGYAKYGFKNQGECIKAVKLPPPADTTAPETLGGEGVGPSPTQDNTPQFGFSSTEEGSTFECRLLGLSDAWELCTSVKQYGQVTDGPYTFEARAIDTAGNMDPTPYSVSFVVDTTAPVVGITSSVISGNSATFEFTVNDSSPMSTVHCVVIQDPEDPAWQISRRDCTSLQTFGGLAEGDYIFRVIATDMAGNETRLNHSFTIGTTQ